MFYYMLDIEIIVGGPDCVRFLWQIWNVDMVGSLKSFFPCKSWFYSFFEWFYFGFELTASSFFYGVSLFLQQGHSGFSILEMFSEVSSLWLGWYLNYLILDIFIYLSLSADDLW